MTQRSLQRTTAAAALAMVLTLAGPAHAAATRHGRIAAPGWMDTVLQWVAQLWPGAPAGGQAPGLKSDQGHGIDPNGALSTPPPSSNPDKGGGIDPNG
ncbi:MAG: hypothetical protein ABIS20_07735 [Thermoanaerobaculia bacterium]